MLYTGVTNDIAVRTYQHKHKLIKGFTAKYNVDKLIYIQSFESISEAIVYEKRIKGWTRNKKIELIKENNPKWEDLYSSLAFLV